MDYRFSGIKRTYNLHDHSEGDNHVVLMQINKEKQRISMRTIKTLSVAIDKFAAVKTYNINKRFVDYI